MKIIPNLLFDFHNDCIDLDGNLVFKKAFSMEEYMEYKESVYPPRHAFEMELAEKVMNEPGKTYQLAGYSDTAGSLTEFRLDMDYSNGQMPNYRERLVCPLTQLNNRQRFICNYLKKVTDLHNYSSLFAFEQATPIYRQISYSLNKVHIIGSEYLGIYSNPGSVVNGIRHEDTTNLSFNDQSFDVVFSCEVLNRTPDLTKTISETHRILKEGGMFIFSTPFMMNSYQTTQRAKVTGNGVNHFFDARYYTGPHTGGEQSPVFYDLGWDMLDQIKQSGFKTAYLLCYYSAFYGYLGDSLQSVFIAEK